MEFLVRTHRLLTATFMAAGLSALTACSSSPVIGPAAAPATSNTAPTAAAPTASAASSHQKTDPNVERTVVADYTPLGDDLTSSGLDFAILTKVTSRNGRVTLTIDRASYYSGPEAVAHNNGEPPANDYVIVNNNPTLRTFVLDPQASLQAEQALRNNPDETGRETLTRSQFVRNSARVASPPLVWLRHTDGLSGPVTALAEQFVP
jgi:hypothetical protein